MWSSLWGQLYIAAVIGDKAAGQWLVEHFEFAEFGVIPSMRQCGTGRRLYDALFDRLPHSRAVLIVGTPNQTARQFYERRGWVALHHNFFLTTGQGPYIIMGRELKSTNVFSAEAV